MLGEFTSKEPFYRSSLLTEETVCVSGDNRVQHGNGPLVSLIMSIGNTLFHIYRGQVTGTNIRSVVTQMLFLHVGYEVVDTRH